MSLPDRGICMDQINETCSHAELTAHTRKMIMLHYIVEDADENTLYFQYQGFYLQVSFTDQHPLMYFQLVKNLGKSTIRKNMKVVNALNLKSVLGTHSVNDEKGCYIYRTVHWLDCRISPDRFSVILQRCTDEAHRGYASLYAS